MKQINWPRIVAWLIIGVVVVAISSCIARVEEARFKALETCNGTCIY